MRRAATTGGRAAPRASAGRDDGADDAWKSTAWGWARRVERYHHRNAVENAARKYGAALGPLYRGMLVGRLVLVDIDDEGGALTLDSAVTLVEAWAAEGPRDRRPACRG